MNLREIVVQPVAADEEERFRALMEAHHYLGALAKIGHTLWYVATWNGQWLALLSFSAAAWKCAARDAWIGWDFRHQYDRLHLVANNSRFLILPEYHYANLASRVLALSERRLAKTGGSASVTRCCCWRPSSIRGVFTAPSTAPPTGAMWATPAAIGAPAPATAPRRAPPSAFLSAPCTPEPKPACRIPYSTPSIATEPRESC